MTDLLIDALFCRNERRPPVWLMRQAGRYMPQYRAMREKTSLWEMFHNSVLAAEVTLLPIQLLDVDAAILFSDILVIAESLGLHIQFPEKGGPRIVPSITAPEHVDALPILDIAQTLIYVFETIARVKQRLSVPLIGFCGGPFTIATYCIDSTSTHPFYRTRQWILEDKESFHRLLEKLTIATIIYLKEQVKAGVDVIQIFDSWANRLSLSQFHEFCLPYLKRIIEALKDLVPVIVFCRDSSLRYAELSTLKPTCISLDWHRSMSELRSLIPPTIAVQGNVPPELLKRPLIEIQEHVDHLLTSMRGERGFIVNLGHGVLPDIPFEHVRFFVNAIKKQCC